MTTLSNLHYFLFMSHIMISYSKREGQRDRDRQTDRQTDGHTEGERERQPERKKVSVESYVIGHLASSSVLIHGRKTAGLFLTHKHTHIHTRICMYKYNAVHHTQTTHIYFTTQRQVTKCISCKQVCSTVYVLLYCILFGYNLYQCALHAINVTCIKL